VTSTNVTDIDFENLRLRFQLHDSLCSNQARMALAKQHRVSLETAEAKFPELLDELSMHKRDLEDYEDSLHSHQTSIRQCVAITFQIQELLDRGVPNEVLVSLLQAVEAMYETLRENAAAIRVFEARFKRLVDNFDDLAK
jgi:predicted  nucleic acid-binding Zn-ribbon protein